MQIVQTCNSPFQPAKLAENNFFFTSFDFFCEKPFFWTTFLLLYYRGKNKKEKIVV